MYSPKKSSVRPAFFAVLIFAFLPAVSEAAKPDKPGSGDTRLEYDIYQLDSAGGAFSGFAVDLDDFGLVVGQAADNSTGDVFAACWEVTVAGDGTVTSSLSLLPGSSGTRATAVNNVGEVVGDAPLLGGPGLYWPSITDQPLALLPLSGDTDAQPHRINDAGVICGSSIGSGNHPVVWRVTSDNNGDPVVVGPVALPSTSGGAWDLSEAGPDGTVTVAGEAWELSAGVTWRVQLQSNGGISIDPQPTIVQVGVNVYGINDTGVVCGNSSRPDWIAMLWTENVQIPLDRPRRFAKSSANDLNDSGVVVGWVGQDGSGFPWEATVWAGPDAKPVLLSSFLHPQSPFDVLRGTSAAINQSGVIVGAGWDGNAGTEQAFIALPR